MSQFPDDIASFRSRTNRTGITYDSSKSDRLYAEDVIGIEDEIIALEEELGTNTKGSHDSVADRFADLESDVGYKTGATKSPTINVATFDDGSGNQPTVNFSKRLQIGKLVYVEGKISGYKAGAGQYIATTAFDLPTPANLVTGSCVGNGHYDYGADYKFLSVVYRSSGVWWIWNPISWSDNQDLRNGVFFNIMYIAA